MGQPGGVKVLVGCYLLAAGIYPWALQFPLLSVLLYLIFSLVMVFGLWKLRNWARVAEILLCGAAMLFCTAAYLAYFPVLSVSEKLTAGSICLVLNIIHLWIIYYFLKPGIRKRFI